MAIVDDHHNKTKHCKMKNPDFVLLADEGKFIAYRIEHPAGRGDTPHLVDSFNPVAVHQRAGDKFTDQAGAFPNFQFQVYGNAFAERPNLELEESRRAVATITDHMNDFLEEQDPETWSFAASSPVNERVLSGVGDHWKERLARNLTKDLVNEPEEDLLTHFDAR